MSSNDSVSIERAPRNETNWIATIRTFDGAEIPCTVKDISKTGARIGLPSSCQLPDSFMLKVIGKDFVCRVSLAWRKGNFVGVHIEQFGKVASKVRNVEEAKSQAHDASYKAIGARRSRVSTF